MDTVPNQGLSRVNVLLAFEETTTGIKTPPAPYNDKAYISMLGRNVDDLAIQATVEGTGAVTATVQIEVSNDAKGWVTDSIATLALSGTTTATKGFTSNAAWTYWRANITAISGTGAKVTVSIGG